MKQHQQDLIFNNRVSDMFFLHIFILSLPFVYLVTISNWIYSNNITDLPEIKIDFNQAIIINMNEPRSTKSNPQ